MAVDRTRDVTGHAIDRLEPAERGSEWLTGESLDLRGRLRPSFGYVLGWARRSLVVPVPGGSRAPVEDLVVLHLGGLDSGEHRAMLPALELARKTLHTSRAE